MVEFKKDANRLRMWLRTIPREGYFVVDDCRTITGKEVFPSLSPVHNEQLSLYFFNSPDRSRVLLVPGGIKVKKEAGKVSELLGGFPEPEEYEIFCIFFHHAEHGSTPRKLPPLTSPLVDDSGPMDWYESQFSFLYHEHLDSLGEFRRGLCGSLVHVILSQMVLTLEGLSRPSYSRSDLLHICQLIKRHPEKRFAVQELAEKAGLSARHFTRIFTSALGQSPKQYELRQRMSHARFLMQHKGLNVHETAEACGYSDPFLFSRQYKGAFGVSPSRHMHDNKCSDGKKRIENLSFNSN